MARLKIGNRCIGEDSSTFIIAEIGQNHQGDISVAKQLITIAQQCGADCVKFQKTSINEKFNKEALERPYLNENSWGLTYGDHKKHLEFSNDEFRELQEYANQKGILFTASAMDEKSLSFLQSLQVPFIKIGSGDNNNLIMIEKAAATHFPLVVSTGMQNFDDVQTVYDCVSKFHKNFALLHCVSSYPTPTKNLNLKVIDLFQNKFPDVVIGYSGHELGTDATVAAVALGAKIIERHITLDKNQKGSDHKCSLEPKEFETLVSKIRNIEVALGKPIKLFQDVELPCFTKLRKTLVAAHDLKKGHTLELRDLKIKVAEPKGIDGVLIYSVVGKQLMVDVKNDESVTANCLE